MDSNARTLQEIALELFKPKAPTSREELFASQREGSSSTDSSRAFIDGEGWNAVERLSGGTYTGGTDWEFNFQDGTVTYYRYGAPTLCGELLNMHPVGNVPAQFQLRFYSPVERTVSAYLYAAGWSATDAQIKFNGATTDYTANAAVTLSVRKGMNVLSVFSNGTVTNLSLRGDIL